MLCDLFFLLLQRSRTEYDGYSRTMILFRCDILVVGWWQISFGREG